MARRILPSTAVAAAILLVAAGPITGPADIEELIRVGKLDEAIAGGKAAVQSRPKDPDLHAALAHALAAKGRSVRKVLDVNVGAQDVARGAVQLPVPRPGQPVRVEVRYDPSLLEEALGHIREAIRLAPRRKDVRLTECYLLTDAGDIERAASAIRKTIAAIPPTQELPEDLASFGVERGMRDDPQGAVILLGIVAKAFPKSAPVLADYGLALARSNRKAESYPALDRAATLAPGDAEILRKRAIAELLLRDFGRARAAYQATFAVTRQDQDRLVAAACLTVTDPKAAKAELEELTVPSASQSPEVISAATALLATLSGKSRSKESLELAKRFASERKELLAIPVLQRVLRASPGEQKARVLLSQVYRALGSPILADQAIAAAAPAAGKPPTKAPARPKP